jgi:hypothetical protein
MPAKTTTRKTASSLKKSEYLPNGVKISPAIPTVGDNISLVYSGLLAQSGAENVYAHIGFDEDWNDTRDFMMEKIPEGFEVMIPISGKNKLNISFKDSANNWDNNSGNNYTFSIS